MSYQDGWAAMNLEMPKRIPRSEFSANMHWDLITAVTGQQVTAKMTPEQREPIVREFLRRWNYDFWWSILVYHDVFGSLRTSMGHAEYMVEREDFRNDVQCPFKTPEEVLDFDPWQAYGTLDKPAMTRRFNEHYRANCQRLPDLVNQTGIYVTCISGLIDIFGWDMLLLAAGTDLKRFGDMTNRYAGWIQQYFDALAECEAPVVQVHDDIVWTSGPFIAPDWYRAYVFPNYQKYFAPLLARGKKIIFTSDGNYTAFIDDLAATGVHGFIMEPATDMQYIAEKDGRTHVFMGNADTRILLDGTQAQIRAEVERCIRIGKDCPGFFMAVGNHIPPNTPVENALYYNQCYEELSRR
jgi:hypothetical protein